MVLKVMLGYVPRVPNFGCAKIPGSVADFAVVKAWAIVDGYSKADKYTAAEEFQAKDLASPQRATDRSR